MICPNCGGSVQQTQVVDSDDIVISTYFTCKEKIPNKKKKGCGYRTEKLNEVKHG